MACIAGLVITKTNMLGLCLVFTLPVTVFTCSCLPPKPSVMEYICGGEYAIKVEVTGMKDYIYGEYNRTGKLIIVNILQTFWASERYQNLTVKNEIHTGAHSAQCGTQPSNDVYLMVGYIHEGERPGISSCDYYWSWNEAPEKDKDILQTYTGDEIKCSSGRPITSLLAICVCNLLTIVTLLHK